MFFKSLVPPALIMTVGLPASGKSSHVALHAESNAVIISTDTIRGELCGNESDQSKNSEVFNLAVKRIREGLAANKIVYFDATNLKRKRRISFLKQFKCKKYCLLFATPYEECIKNNQNRERKVPLEALNRMYKQFQPPHWCEGFEEIKIISWGGEQQTREEVLEENLKCAHDNHNHSLNCGEHCLAAEQAIYKICADKENEHIELLAEAARYHDMSKFKCKVFTNYKGEPTEEAHYYNHENISAYDYLAGGLPNRENIFEIYVANLIANHMVFYSGEGAISNVRKLYGEEFYENLKILHKADMKAH